MKKGGQIAVIAALLLILAALASTDRRETSCDHGISKGACCPLTQSLNSMLVALETNGAPPIAISTTQAVTNPP